MEYAFPPHGFVRLVDHMGDDGSIVQAARVAYGPGAKTVREDSRLIDYLMEHQHMTPFEMGELKFHIKAPIFVERQWFRHRTASINSVSGRYSEMPEEFYTPPQFMTQDTKNKQGSAAPLSEATQGAAGHTLEEVQRRSYQAYQLLLELGVSREQARLTLPVALYTEWYWKVNLRNCLHFLGLRLDSHAQAEIRAYAGAIAEITKALYPVAYSAWEAHVQQAVTLSQREVRILRRALADVEIPDSGRAASHLRTKLGLADAPPGPSSAA
jgi:thymidylate synthase (FAD)